MDYSIDRSDGRTVSAIGIPRVGVHRNIDVKRGQRLNRALDSPQDDLIPRMVSTSRHSGRTLILCPHA